MFTDKKKIVADKLMGYGTSNIEMDSWTPELGGKDLTKVLSKLDDVRFCAVLMILPLELSCGLLRNFEELKDIIIYLIESKNAETIIEAVYEVVK